MNAARITRYVGTTFFAVGLVLMLGFWWARSTGRDQLGVAFGQGLRFAIFGMLAAAAGVAAYGLVHLILAIFGPHGEGGDRPDS